MSIVPRAVTAAWNRVCVVPAMLVLGERSLRAGERDVARRWFAAAVRRAPSCFRAHFGLARVHAAADEREAARRELVIARHLAPSRFRELRGELPAPYRDEEHMSLPRASQPAASVVAVADGHDIGAHAVSDDFSGAAERARFRALGPLPRVDEGCAVDWDDLAARLAATEHDDE